MPSRTIAMVEKRLSTIFCAVPAFMRVEPAGASGPVSTRIGCSLADRSFEPELLATPIVSAPRMRASVIAATVNGVLPLAARPMTTSLGPTVRPAMPATALGPESSAFSTARSNAASPPAIRKAT